MHSPTTSNYRSVDLRYVFSLFLRANAASGRIFRSFSHDILTQRHDKLRLGETYVLLHAPLLILQRQLRLLAMVGELNRSTFRLRSIYLIPCQLVRPGAPVRTLTAIFSINRNGKHPCNCQNRLRCRVHTDTAPATAQHLFSTFSFALHMSSRSRSPSALGIAGL
jgi:hypothetical protein